MFGKHRVVRSISCFGKEAN